ncbi:type II toxin-antitoxin system PemK/MazF family toxin [Pseudomonas sp. TE3911]
MTILFRPLPAPGDIVWCHFPQVIGNPGPKARPALVIAIFDNDHAVRIAYGTSQKTEKVYPGEFVLDPADAGFPLSGLAQRTKFDLNNTVDVFFDSDWFAPNQSVHASTPLPKMGRLDISYMPAAQKARKAVKPKK